MPLVDALIGPIASIIDKVIPDKAQRDKAPLDGRAYVDAVRKRAGH